MAVATLDSRERSLLEGLNGSASLLFEGDGDERLDAGGRAVIVPGEGEDETPVRDDLAIDPAEPVFAMLWRGDQDAVGAADTKIDFCLGTDEIRRTHPALDVF